MNHYQFEIRIFEYPSKKTKKKKNRKEIILKRGTHHFEHCRIGILRYTSMIDSEKYVLILANNVLTLTILKKGKNINTESQVSMIGVRRSTNITCSLITLTILKMGKNIKNESHVSMMGVRRITNLTMHTYNH